VRWNLGENGDGTYLIINTFKLCKVNFNDLVDNLNGLSSDDRIISIIKV
jgi:hypothetical protein